MGVPQDIRNVDRPRNTIVDDSGREGGNPQPGNGKVMRPGIADDRYSNYYGRTFVSEYYPNVAMGKNTVGSLFKRLGMDGSKRKAFYASRLGRVSSDHHIAIDGTLKQDTSTANDLFAFSHKARARGCRVVPVICAYDMETVEPLCAEAFPGNSMDATSFSAFISDNNITEGIIVADKGFPISAIEEDLKDRPRLHFISPIKRNDRRIATNGVLASDEVLTGTDKSVVTRKVALKNGRYLYAFRDRYLGGKEERSVIAKAKRKKSFDSEKYLSHWDRYGLIVFESDLDLSPSQVYKGYEDRWLLKLLFAQYKGEEFLDPTNVQGDYSLIGEEFVNFVAGSTGRPSSDDRKWVHTLPSVLASLEKLGLSEPLVKEPKKVGRPKKEKVETGPGRIQTSKLQRKSYSTIFWETFNISVYKYYTYNKLVSSGC
ncbi:MAG: transposase [Sphaerochaeta sp.]